MRVTIRCSVQVGEQSQEYFVSNNYADDADFATARRRVIPNVRAGVVLAVDDALENYDRALAVRRVEPAAPSENAPATVLAADASQPAPEGFTAEEAIAAAQKAGA